MFSTGRLSSEVPYPFIYHFSRKRYPFRAQSPRISFVKKTDFLRKKAALIAIQIKIVVQFFDCKIPESVLLTGAISICKRFSKVSHQNEAKMCGLSLAIFTFCVFKL